MNNELKGMRKELSVGETRQRPQVCLKELRNTTKSLSQADPMSRWPSPNCPHTERCAWLADSLHGQHFGPGCSVRSGRLILLRPFAVFTSTLRGSYIKWFATRGAQIFQKGATSKFWVPEGWYKTSPILRTHKHQATPVCGLSWTRLFSSAPSHTH